MQGISITGRKANEDKYDFYETPTWATEKIVEKLLIDGVINKYDDILEPCSGGGAISRVLETYFEHCTSSDIQEEEYRRQLERLIAEKRYEEVPVYLEYLKYEVRR